MLSKRLTMPGVMNSFVTSGVRPLVGTGATLLDQKGVVGIADGEGDARGKVLTKADGKGKRAKKAKTKEVRAEEDGDDGEEWGGIGS